MTKYQLDEEQAKAIVRLGLTIRNKAHGLGILRPDQKLVDDLHTIQDLVAAMLAIMELAQMDDPMV